MELPASTNRATTTVDDVVDDGNRSIGAPGRERWKAGAVAVGHGTPLGLAR
jgi:hypothetical protein